MAENEQVVVKKDDTAKSDESYAQIVIKKNEELRKAKVHTKEQMRHKETVSGEKTKHYNLNEYKTSKGRVLATKRYCIGVTKAQHGRKRVINTAPGFTEKDIKERERKG